MKTKKSTKKRLFKIFNCLSALSAVAGCFFIPDLHWICWSIVLIIAINIIIVSLLSEVKKDFKDDFVQFVSPWGVSLMAVVALWFFPISILWAILPIAFASLTGFVNIKADTEICSVFTMLIILIVAYALVPASAAKESMNHISPPVVISNK